jgi:hypothetical protein
MTQVTGAMELRALSLRLKAAGTDGKGLRRKLSKQMNEAVLPLAKEISDVTHLRPYLPDRYALVLSADLTARIRNSSASATPRVEVVAKSRAHRRKLVLLDDGIINHPVYARGPRSGWSWSNTQTGGMKAGFFTDAVKDQSPQIRDKIVQAMTEIAREVTRG